LRYATNPCFSFNLFHMTLVMIRPRNSEQGFAIYAITMALMDIHGARC
jgi:hypothetical protein